MFLFIVIYIAYSVCGVSPEKTFWQDMGVWHSIFVCHNFAQSARHE